MTARRISAHASGLTLAFGRRAVVGLAVTGLAVAGLAVATVTTHNAGIGTGIAGVAYAQATEVSDKSVKLLMGFTWSIMGGKFKTIKGEERAIDRTDPNKYVVPIDDARRVIRVARRSAHASICQLPELEAKNYQTMIKAEIDASKWTDEQLFFIQQLHLFTVLYLSGNVKLGEDGKPQQEQAAKPTCSDAQRARVQEQIEAYIKTGKES